VTLRKQQQLSRIAKDYLVRNKIMDTPCRFDVLSIILAEDRSPTIDIVVNAFEYID
jgi:putative endonuclease